MTWRMTWYSSDDAVAAVHVAGDAGDVERLAAVVALHDRDHLGRHRALVEEAADAQRALQAERDLGLHVGELLLHQLVGASGRPNCLRSSVYWRAACQQNSAAPSAPQAMP
jgi:hypothetical protein